MKTITIEIDEKFAELFTLTAIGRDGSMLNASTTACNLSETNHVKIDEKGKTHNSWTENRS